MHEHPDTAPPAGTTLNRAGRRDQARRGRTLAALGSGVILATSGAATANVVLSATPAGASELTVTNLDPSGAGSLHDVAEAAADGDVIVFQSGLSGTIHLADEINIAASVTIQGPGAGVVTVSGENAVRIFDVNIPGGSKSFTISGLTLANGFTAGNGGAIRDANDDIRVVDSVFTGNHASDGGAIYSDTAGVTMTIQGATFSQNTATDGGGAIHMDHGDRLDVKDSHFTDNKAPTTDDGYGGALYLYDFTDGVTITNSTFTGNVAGGSGGGIVAWGVGTFDLIDSQVSGNQAGNTGGGLYLYNDAITITNTDVSNNTAVGRGGGIFFRDARGLTISGSTITGNSSTDNGGGGIWLYDSDAPATISDSTISANSAADSGGGIAAVETVALAVRSSTVSGNTAGGEGGGLWLYSVGTPVEITNSTVSGNTALTGGGITFTGYYGLDVVQSTVTANTAARIDGIQLAGFTNTRDKSASAPASHKHDGPNATDGPRHTHTAAKGTIAVTLTGTILAGNGKTDLGTIGTASSDHSILGTVTGTTVTNLGGTITATDPVLGPLADNGGPTRTHALLPGSPAIDAGEVPVATFPGNDTDQRGTGYPRVVAGVVDIGAFEVQPVVIQPTFTG